MITYFRLLCNIIIITYTHMHITCNLMLPKSDIGQMSELLERN
jgi:hypothetical protein